ncbi:MAG: hypothetical protein PVH77_06705 [Phycisphaerales bacterium]|jgi:hypothetical protein
MGQNQGFSNKKQVINIEKLITYVILRPSTSVKNIRQIRLFMQNKAKVKIGNYESFLGGVSIEFLRGIVLSSARRYGVGRTVKLPAVEIFFTLCFWTNFSWQFGIFVLSFAEYAYWVGFGEANLKRSLNLNGAGLLVLKNSRPRILVGSLDSLAIIVSNI